MAGPVETITLFNAKYVPLREALDGIGGSVEWDNESKLAIIHANGKTILSRMGETQVEVNGSVVTITQPPLIEKGLLYVPEDFFSTVVGQTVDTV